MLLGICLLGKQQQQNQHAPADAARAVHHDSLVQQDKLNKLLMVLVRASLSIFRDM
jgi:hypothetical protein